MRFAYQGFTNSGNRRCFLFHGIEEHAAVHVFSIEVELPMFVQNRMPMQDGPSFCLKLLTNASSAGPIQLERLHSYLIVSEDFRPMLLEREQRAAADAVKRRARSQYRKPPATSNLRIGKMAGHPMGGEMAVSVRSSDESKPWA